MRQVEKRRMCPNCRAFVTTSDRVCPYCDFKLGLSYRDQHADVLGIIPRQYYLTAIILLLNAGLFAAEVTHGMSLKGMDGAMRLPFETLFLYGAKEPRAIAGGEIWRLVTAGFLHGGLLHFIMNSWVLFDLGRQVEESFGTARFIVIYVLSSIAGFILSNWLSWSISTGASAAIYGMIGAMIGLGVRSRTSAGAAIREQFIRWAAYGLVMSFIPGIDLMAHLGGLVMGFIIGFLADRPKLSEGWVNQMWRVTAGLCVAVVVGAFAAMFLRLLMIA